ncbi:MAG: ABC transporter ATP-binding protein [Planctomycetota bacterium]
MILDPNANGRSPLVTVLVRISRECGVGVEHLRAEQLLRDAQDAWPGDEHSQWSRWLRETSESLALRSRVTELPLDDALHLAQDGALLVGGYDGGGGPTVLLGYDGSKAELATGELDHRRRVSREELERQLGAAASNGNGSGPVNQWVVVEHPELNSAAEARHFQANPLRRMLSILKPEWSDIWVIFVFGFIAGVLNLATPIAVEALVNTVSFGTLLQPVLILAGMLLACLAFAAVMRGMQTYVAEIIQRRLLARVSADLAYRLPRVDPATLGQRYGPEVVNRFLDIVTVQKVVADMLLDGIGIVLATLIGMTVLAFYHPWLLGFDVLLLLLIVGGIRVLGSGAVSTGIVESKMKYKLAAWFEDVARCQQGFKTEGGSEFAIDRSNLITAQYLAARRSHFRILFRQIIFLFALQAIAGTVLLGGGGWLVIQGQLTLGQLVAAELIVTTILASMAKLGKHLEGYYDLMASIDKLGALLDLGVERHDGVMSVPAAEAIGVRVNGIKRAGANSVLSRGLTGEVKPGERVGLLGARRSGKSSLLQMVYGTVSPDAGHIEVGGADPRDLRPDILRSRVALVGDVELFEGTIAENVHLRRPGVSTADARNALAAVGLLEDVLALPDGIEAHVNATGKPLTSTQQTLVTIARAMAGRPQLLMLDATLDTLPDADLQTVCGALCDRGNTWTLVVATGRRDIADRFGRQIVLDNGPGG